MRICCVGGVDSELRLPFLEALTGQGFEVTAVTSGPLAPFAAAGIGCAAYRLDRFVNPVADIASVGALAAIIRRRQPDVVQTFDTKPGLLGPLAVWLAGRGTPVVRTVNGAGQLFSPDASGLVACLRRVFGMVQRAAAPLVAVNVFQNGDDRRLYLGHGFAAAERSCLIPGSGIDAIGFGAGLEPGAGPALRRALGLGDRPIVLTVSRLTRQKGIGTLLRAAALVHARRPDAVFLLAGPRGEEGPFAIGAAEIEAHAPYVRWLGRRDNVPALLAAADLFVLPTEYREGVPRALLEAGAARVPAIATAMPGCTDLIDHGRTGLLVPPGDPPRLAEAVLRALERPEEGRAQAAALRRDVVEGYGLDGVVASYARLYRRVGRRRSGNGQVPTGKRGSGRSDGEIHA